MTDVKATFCLIVIDNLYKELEKHHYFKIMINYANAMIIKY